MRGLTRGAYVVPLVDGTLKALTFPKLPVGSGTIALRQSDLKKNPVSSFSSVRSVFKYLSISSLCVSLLSSLLTKLEVLDSALWVVFVIVFFPHLKVKQLLVPLAQRP